MNKVADLHIHTHFSDSTFSPHEVVLEAHKHGLNCIAITDHDTIDGIHPTRMFADQYGIEVISGVELSSEINNKDVHILGYCFDFENGPLLDQLKSMQQTRIERMKTMIEKLKELGINNIEFGEISALAKSDSLGRPHLASIMLQKGWVKNIREAFDKYLKEGAPAYVRKFKLSPQEAIAMINNAGGVAVLAHPMFTQVDELIPEFVRSGMRGLEVIYPNVSENVMNFYAQQAKKHHLVVTGGSDAHGEVKVHTYIGKVKIPYTNVQQLKDMAK